MMARLGPDPLIHPDCEITEARFGAWVEIGKGSRIAHSTLGDYSYCDRYADIANTSIGKFANIASFTRIGPTDHPMGQASLHHFLYRSGDYWDDADRDEAFFARRLSRRARIGHDTWIGHGAVVTHDVAPYLIVAGVPAAPLRERFAAPVADRLLALAWWDWDHATLRRRLPDFRALKIEAFVEKYG